MSTVSVSGWLWANTYIMQLCMFSDGWRAKGRVTLAAISGTTFLVPYHTVKSLQVIWGSDTHRFHLRPNFKWFAETWLTTVQIGHRDSRFQGWGEYWTYEYEYWKISTRVLLEFNVFSVFMFINLGKTSTWVVLASALVGSVTAVRVTSLTCPITFQVVSYIINITALYCFLVLVLTTVAPFTNMV